jgi:replicative DNA helicase
MDLVVVDYLGLVEQDKAAGSLYEQTTKTSKALKAMALELGVVVIAAVQLNRDAAKGGQGGKSRRPGMADFRDSGAIEQDCDVAILIHQEGGEEGIRDGEALLIIGKQRNGRKCDVTVRWRESCARFEGVASVEDLTPAHSAPTRVPQWRDD